MGRWEEVGIVQGRWVLKFFWFWFGCSSFGFCLRIRVRIRVRARQHLKRYISSPSACVRVCVYDPNPSDQSAIQPQSKGNLDDPRSSPSLFQPQEEGTIACSSPDGT